MAPLALLTLGTIAIFSRDAAESVVHKMKGFSPATWVAMLIGASLVGMVLMEHQ